MEELKDNINEFLTSGKENLEKDRHNAAVSDFFKAIVISCDYLIYKEIKILPKNHGQRFSLLEKYFKYTESYDLRLKKEDAIKLQDYANELKDLISNKK
jgi:hypothetical protein